MKQRQLLEVIRYTYDGWDVIREDSSLKGVTVYQNGLGIDDKLRSKNGTTVRYFLTDHLGSTVALTNSSGAITSSTTYDSFGNAIPKQAAGSAASGAGNAAPNIATSYRYTGREYDSDTGLYYYRNRWYDPETGRFISEDPIGFAGGDINLYGYVGNNPQNFIDPYGNYACKRQKGGKQKKTDCKILIDKIRELSASNDINSSKLVEELEKEFATPQRNTKYEASGFKKAYQDKPGAPSANQVRHTIGILAAAYDVGYYAYFSPPRLWRSLQTIALHAANEREWSYKTVKVNNRLVRRKYRDYGNKADVRLNSAVVPIGFVLGLGRISKNKLAGKLEEAICK